MLLQPPTQLSSTFLDCLFASPSFAGGKKRGRANVILTPSQPTPTVYAHPLPAHLANIRRKALAHPCLILVTTK